MILQHDLGQSLELRDPSRQTTLWKYVYGGKPRPFFHPVCTPAGHTLTIFEPHDHVWQRGLWFTIKFINGENFWEEKFENPWGTQETLLPPTITPGADGRIAVFSRQEWRRPQGKGVVINEQRQFEYRPIDSRSYCLDFFFSLVPTMDVLLDRTVYTTWGGYGGLVIRGNRNWEQTKMLFPDGSTSDRPIGNRANWCDFSGKLDGGRDIFGGIAMFDHPSNPRHPSPWYGQTGPKHSINAAFLFHEPMKVAAGQPLTLRYRVLLHDDLWKPEELQAAYDIYLKDVPAH